MKSFLWVAGLAGALSLATNAGAVTCTATWCFGSNPTQISNGTSYSSSAGTIYVYGEQITNSTGAFYSGSNSTIGGLFSVNDTVNHEGVGIAPFDPTQGTSGGFQNQDGITDSANGSSTKGNILLLELGSNIAQGTTLNFLLQAGIGASSDVVEAYYLDTTSAPTSSVPGVGVNSMTKFAQTTPGQISTDGTTSQFSLVKNTAGYEFVAIEADCHYLLLDTITATPPSSTPEPRFYGLMLAGLLGIAGMAYQKRRAAQANV